MKIRVQVWAARGDDVKPVGYIICENGVLRGEPADEMSISETLRDPILYGKRTIDPVKEPEAWTLALEDVYRGTAFSCGPTEILEE